MKISPLLLATLCAASWTTAPLRADPASDDAANYSTWTNGDNQGAGFGNWDLTDNNNDGSTNFAGYFLGDSTAGSGDINTSGQSFGIFANPSSAYANAIRGFANPLVEGEVFEIQLAVNFRNGNKGLSINDDTLGELFNFNVGGDDYQVNTNSLSLDYASDSIFSFRFEQKTGTTVGVRIERDSTSFGNEVAFDQDLDFGAAMDNFKLYNTGTGTTEAPKTTSTSTT